ncbi:MAG: DUF6515 family protein [Candidatus Omnitrophota bacterium]
MGTFLTFPLSKLAKRRCVVRKGIAKTFVAVLILGLSLSVYSQEAFAAKSDRRSHGSHQYYGKKVRIPRKPDRVVVGKNNFYFYAGLFLELFDNDYVIVTAPAGAVVNILPRGHKMIMFNGTTYYYYNDVYYVRRPQGYVVVEDPIYYVPTVPSDVRIVSASEAAEVSLDSFTVNVPNKSGGYTPVVIKRSGDGFVGPQGEYYLQFPKVEQLKAMYCG